MISVAEGWLRLGIAATDDKREVKRAYGRALKAIDPDSDPQAFLELRAAYETALEWGTETPFWEQESLDEAPLPEMGGDEEADAEAEAALDESWWEPWRPELPRAAQSDGLGETCQRLDRLLFDEPSPTPEAILEAGEAVMAHPELAKVDRLTETELWLAEAITASSPRSDPLIDAAIARFGWKKTSSDWRRHYSIASVMARRDDIVFLAQCRRPPHMHRAAVAALSEPPPDRLPLGKLHLAGDVRRFLDAIAAGHPTVERDLDPDSLAWWREYLHGRHLPPGFVIWVVGTPTFLSAVAVFALAQFGLSLWLLLPVFILTMAGTAGFLVGKAELDARSRRREIEGWGDERAAEGIERIVVPALLLPLLVALLPVGNLWASLSLTAALGLAAAGLRRAWVEPSWAVTERDRVFLPVVAAVAGLAALALGTAAEALKMVPPIAAMTWLGSRAFAPVQLRVQEMGRSAWLGLMAGALTLIGLAAWLLLEAAAGAAAPLWMLMLAPTAIVAGHLAAAASPVDVHVAEWPLRVVAILLYFGLGYLGENLSWLRIMIAISAYGLLYAGARLAAAIVTEARRRREQA